MKLVICKDKFSLAQAASEKAATALRNALLANGKARIIAATGAAHARRAGVTGRGACRATYAKGAARPGAGERAAQARASGVRASTPVRAATRASAVSPCPAAAD